MTDKQAASIEQTILFLLARRDEDRSICPSEVAREMCGSNNASWRDLMPVIRSASIGLVRAEKIRITRGANELSTEDLSGGPIRFRRGKKFAAE
jgi:hypothetical protein